MSNSLATHRVEGARLEHPTLGTFVRIPAGEGVVGNEQPVVRWDGSRYDEYPANGPRRQLVFESPFWMGHAPVTVAAFRRLCPEVFADDPLVHVLPASQEVGDPWPACPFSTVNSQPDLPVVGVAWEEAARFSRRLGAELGSTARLPREEEWEYAARAGRRELYWWGDQVRASLEHAWTRRNSGLRVQPGATLPANLWGLHDTAGNVWEWCAGRFQGSDMEETIRRPIRGGGAFNEPTAARVAHRWGLPPTTRNGFLGFRVLIHEPGA